MAFTNLLLHLTELAGRGLKMRIYFTSCLVLQAFKLNAGLNCFEKKAFKL